MLIKGNFLDVLHFQESHLGATHTERSSRSDHIRMYNNYYMHYNTGIYNYSTSFNMKL